MGLNKGVTVVEGDLFESECQTLTNAINIVGVMGGGIAKAFADRHPIMLADYKKRCAAKEVVMGKPYLFNDYVLDEAGETVEKNVLNFPTMIYPGSNGDLPMIDKGLGYLAKHCEEWGITSLALPALGCGIGRLSFSQVETAIRINLGHLDIPVELYAPHAPPVANDRK